MHSRYHVCRQAVIWAPVARRLMISISRSWMLGNGTKVPARRHHSRSSALAPLWIKLALIRIPV